MHVGATCAVLLFTVISAQRSQFEVDCPRLCRCNKTTVECGGTQMQGSDVFLNIRPEAYPELDTIVVTGNAIGDLAGSNMFGANVTNRYVSLVNLSSNAISAIDSYTFRGLPAVEYFYLSDNAIERIGTDPFRSAFHACFLGGKPSYMFPPPILQRALDNRLIFQPEHSH